MLITPSVEKAVSEGLKQIRREKYEQRKAQKEKYLEWKRQQAVHRARQSRKENAPPADGGM